MRIQAEILECPRCSVVAAYRLADSFSVCTRCGWEGGAREMTLKKAARTAAAAAWRAGNGPAGAR